MKREKIDLLRAIMFSLGTLWLLDGILQLQPAMFTSAFVQQVLSPTLAGQPGFVTAIINFGISIWSLNPFWFNVVAAGVQLLISILLLLPLRCDKNEPHTGTHRFDWQRFALWLSIAWALIIWIFGEGFGLLFTGSATFYTGAPGSALLYAILALFLLDAMNERDAGSDKNPLAKLLVAAGIIFLVGAALQFTPMFWQPTMLSMLATVPTVSNWLGLFGAQGTLLGNFLAIDILAALGIFLICLPRNRAVAWTATIFLILVWWIGQNFGGIQIFPFGTATDPNSAVVMIVFLLPALWDDA